MLGNPRVLYLAAIAFLFMIGSYVTGFWMPQSINAVGHGLSHLAVGLLVMVPNGSDFAPWYGIEELVSQSGAVACGASLIPQPPRFASLERQQLSVCILLWSVAT
jgi:hypothetical protein